MAGKKKKKVSSSNRRGMAGIVVVVMTLLVVLLFQSQHLSAKNSLYAAQEETLEQQITEEKLRTEELKKLPDYISSDEYIEKLAREKLGLVYPDELVFVAEK